MGFGGGGTSRCLSTACRIQASGRVAISGGPIWKSRERLVEPSAGYRTVKAVRLVLEKLVARNHGSLSFQLYGCFGRHLYNIVGRDSTQCATTVAVMRTQHYTSWLSHSLRNGDDTDGDRGACGREDDVLSKPIRRRKKGRKR